jgi:predicted ATPase
MIHLPYFGVKDFRAFEGRKDFHFRDITFLIGPNSSGKSSLVDCIVRHSEIQKNNPLEDDDYILNDKSKKQYYSIFMRPFYHPNAKDLIFEMKIEPSGKFFIDLCTENIDMNKLLDDIAYRYEEYIPNSKDNFFYDKRMEDKKEELISIEKDLGYAPQTDFETEEYIYFKNKWKNDYSNLNEEELKKLEDSYQKNARKEFLKFLKLIFKETPAFSIPFWLKYHRLHFRSKNSKKPKFGFYSFNDYKKEREEKDLIIKLLEINKYDELLSLLKSSFRDYFYIQQSKNKNESGFYKFKFKYSNKNVLLDFKELREYTLIAPSALDLYRTYIRKGNLELRSKKSSITNYAPYPGYTKDLLFHYTLMRKNLFKELYCDKILINGNPMSKKFYPIGNSLKTNEKDKYFKELNRKYCLDEDRLMDKDPLNKNPTSELLNPISKLFDLDFENILSKNGKFYTKDKNGNMKDLRSFYGDGINKTILNFYLSFSSLNLKELQQESMISNMVNAMNSIIYGENTSHFLFIFNEPEVHLHPSLQAKLADFFVYIINKFNCQVIVETHSEYLIRRMQNLIANTTQKTKEDLPKITPEQVNIYYFNDPRKCEKEDHVYEIEFTPNGKLTKDFGPGFYDEADNLAANLYDLINANN